MKKVLATLGLAAALAVGGTVISGTPVSLATPKAEAASYSSCYRAMDGRTWCYRYGCTSFEYWAMGCRDGWVPTTQYWYA